MIMYRFALLGAGFIGSVHAANLADHPRVDFAVVYDIDSLRAKRLAAAHGVHAVDSLEAALDPDRLDAFERVEVLGSTGMIEARRNRTGSVSRYQAGRIVDDGLHAGWFERVQPTYAAALDHFVRCLEENSAITPSLDDGLKAQAIAEAATRSLTSKRSEPVTYYELS
jgi:predicted dehydrogenase